jgi:DNA-binding NtrC family response regulator
VNERIPHILVVDEQLSVARPLARMLELIGYRVQLAATGVQALDCFERTRFDLVVLDLKLPDLHGLDVLAAAHAQAPDIPFIICTAYGSLDSAIAALRRGAFDYLVKPCSADEIVGAIRRGLENGRLAYR